MTVNEVYQLMQFIINKNQAGNLTPADFNLVIAQGQSSWMDYLLGESQQYQNGRPVSRVSWGQNERIRQSLTPVIYGYINNLDSNGNCPYPLDFQQVDAMFTLYGNSRIRYVPQDALYSYINSKIDPIATNPIYLIHDAGLKFYPENLGQTKMSYVRNPPPIKWGYTLDVNGRPVYNPNDSIDPVWRNSDILEVIVRALRLVGCNLQLNQVSQYANEIKNQGQ